MTTSSRRLRQLSQHLTFPSDAPSGEAGVVVETFEVSPGHNVATVTISNPLKVNIVNTYLLQKLAEAFKELADDKNLRAVVLTGGRPAPGKAPSFIGGADVREMVGFSTPDEGRAFITNAHRVSEAIRQLPAPVIARVHGFSLGAGFEIMIACDLRLATKTSTFAMPEVKVGIPSVIEAAYLPGLVGMGRARRMLYLAESIDGLTAEKWGLIEKVVENEAELDAAVSEWVNMIISMGPNTIRSQKRLMQKWENVTVDQGILAGIDAYAESFADGGKEPKEYMKKFLERKR